MATKTGQLLLGSVLTGAAMAAVGAAVMPYYIHDEKPATYGPIPTAWRNVHVGLFATGFFARLALGLTGADRRIPQLLLKAPSA
jgi:hypothetical protein